MRGCGCLILIGLVVALGLSIPRLARFVSTPDRSAVAPPVYDQLVITEVTPHTDEWGTECALGVKNISDRDIREVVVLYSAIAPNGKVLATRKLTIPQMLFPAHSDRVVYLKPATPSGLIADWVWQSDKASVEVESYTTSEPIRPLP